MGDLPRWLRGLAGATRGVATRPVTGIIAGWGEAQALDIYGQLTAGARYLDLRVVHERGRYFTEHGMAGASFESIFAQIDAFLKSPARGGGVRLQPFHRFETAEDHHGFLDLLERTLGLHVAPLALRRASDSGGTVTHRELLARETMRVPVRRLGPQRRRAKSRRGGMLGTQTPRPVEPVADGVLAPLAGGAHESPGHRRHARRRIFRAQGVVTPDAAASRNLSSSRTEVDRGRSRRWRIR